MFGNGVSSSSEPDRSCVGRTMSPPTANFAGDAPANGADKAQATQSTETACKAKMAKKAAQQRPQYTVFQGARADTMAANSTIAVTAGLMP